MKKNSPKASSAKESPGNTLDGEDPGDDVQSRYRYQHAYTAIQFVRLVTENKITLVICENYEDLLIQESDKRFRGIQVKTRLFSGSPFRSSDQSFQKALGRFAKLELRFGGSFCGYTFVTNHDFYSKPGDGNPRELIALAKERSTVKHLPKSNPLRAFTSKVSSDWDCSEDHVLSALQKLTLTGYRQSEESSYQDLLEVLGPYKSLRKDYPMDTLMRAADNLVFLAYQSSAKVLGAPKNPLYDPSIELSDAISKLRLAGKTIRAKQVRETINEALKEGSPNQLISSGLVSGHDVPPGVHTMEEKLINGGLEQERIEVIGDAVTAIETAYLEWLYKYDEATAAQRYQHLMAQVHDDCVEAKVAAVPDKGGRRGHNMYKKLRENLKQRISDSNNVLFGCSELHLLGLAGVLTQQCKVWWGDKFKLKSSV